MKTWRRLLFSILAAIVLFVGFILFWMVAPQEIVYRSELRTGKIVVSRVEAYRNSYGSLPDSLGAVGMNELDLNVYYQKIDSRNYIVWFGTTLGESMTYHSDLRKWQ